MHRVTIRIKRELYEKYQIFLIEKGLTMKDDLTKHIESQETNYQLPSNYVSSYSNMEFKKLNFAVDKALYKKYKIVLIKNSTTPTADIIRYIMQAVETKI